MGNWKGVTSELYQGFGGCRWKEFIWKMKGVCLRCI